jgi:hypothetical protein
MTPDAGPGRGWLRRAGRFTSGGGDTVLWSVAEGRRGRRWRSLRRDAAGPVIADLLLEIDPGGRWTRLELATTAGILTLHPEPDERSVHGNVVTERGVVPLALLWSADHRLLLPDEPVAAAALGSDEANPPSGPAIVVDARLEPLAVEAAAVPRRPPDGLPGVSWPLEVDDPIT